MLVVVIKLCFKGNNSFGFDESKNVSVLNVTPSRAKSIV
jgi:hypothetical protein